MIISISLKCDREQALQQLHKLEEDRAATKDLLRTANEMIDRLSINLKAKDEEKRNLLQNISLLNIRIQSLEEDNTRLAEKLQDIEKQQAATSLDILLSKQAIENVPPKTKRATMPEDIKKKSTDTASLLRASIGSSKKKKKRSIGHSVIVSSFGGIKKPAPLHRSIGRPLASIPINSMYKI